MFSVRISAGRLLEIRIASPFVFADFKPFHDLVRKLLIRAPGKVVTCCDLRKATAFTQDVVQGVIDLLRVDNLMIERTGILLSGSAVLSMQMERMVRSANNPSRRTFNDPKEGVAWLSEILVPEERIALQRFVAS